jgi:hypothetical protein
MIVDPHPALKGPFTVDSVEKLGHTKISYQ